MKGMLKTCRKLHKIAPAKTPISARAGEASYTTHTHAKENLETVLQDVSMYAAKDKGNPYSIKEILIKSKFLKEESA